MRFSIVAVGKMKQRGLREAVDDYLGRIQRYCPCDEVELKDADGPDMVARFARAVPRLGSAAPGASRPSAGGGARAERGLVVALEVDGKQWDSHRLARFVDRCEQDAVPQVSWLIGGAYGLPPAISDAADVKLSLSAMTLPHRLARVMLAEQLYRAFTILRNEPYSH